MLGEYISKHVHDRPIGSLMSHKIEEPQHGPDFMEFFFINGTDILATRLHYKESQCLGHLECCVMSAPTDQQWGYWYLWSLLLQLGRFLYS